MGRPKSHDRIRIETLMAQGLSGRDLLDVAERLGIARERASHIAQQVLAESRRKRGRGGPEWDETEERDRGERDYGDE